MSWFRRGRGVVGLDIGVRSDGRRLVLPFPRLPHVLVAGLTGSGKSGVLNALLWSLAPLPNVAVFGGDLKRIEFSPWQGRMTVLAREPHEVDDMLVGLRLEVDRRERLLESRGLRYWSGDLGPWIVVVVDEFAELATADLDRFIEVMGMVSSGEKDKALNGAKRAAGAMLGIRSGILESFARKCRALGVTLVVATQYPSADVIDTQVRAQLGIRLMCRVSSTEQVKVCLGSGMEDVAAHEDLSPGQPGSFWCAGLEPATFMGRASWISDRAVTNRVAETAHLRVPVEAVFVDQDDARSNLDCEPVAESSTGVVVS